MHNLTKHKGLKFECNICCKEFADPSSMRKHKKYTHEGIRYNCNNCEYAGGTFQLLKLHKTKVHIIIINDIEINTEIKYSYFNLKGF